MKFRRLLATAAVTSLFLVKAAQGFAQTPSVLMGDIADDLDEFANDISGALPFMASIGLDWADAYIGQLIDITPHWGFGITAGANTLKLDKLNSLLRNFDYQANEGFMDKQLMPTYVANARIGGFRTLPFDIGIKWGWLPYLPIFKEDISYEAVLYGLDFRLELMRDWGLRPSVSLGFEVSRVTGGLRSKSDLELDAGNGIKLVTSGDATIGPVWEAWVFDAKLQVAKKFWEPRFNLFGGVRLGAALTKTGYQLAGSGSDIKIESGGNSQNLEDLNDKARNDFAEILNDTSENDISFEVTNEGITGWIDKFGVNLNLHGGVSFNFDSGFRLEMALMADIIHFELGANIGLRYQQ
ncbi:MAG: hypothetical protein LBD86_05060 [Spirochaetaceae bacterium]|jgi:hypothetical protein|nr:hypothetical protein [Spirochaetaceae bacterium]